VIFTVLNFPVKLVINQGMKPALFDILTNNYKNPEFDSIKAHLDRLLNARTGSLQHMPDYGLPDVTELYQDLPYSVATLTKAMETAIAKYEMRLQNVKIKHKKQADRNDCVLQIEISATTHDNQPVDLNTYFNSAGGAEISTS
jgi:type VI secretion system protein